MRSGSGEKLLVSRATNGHWLYVNVLDDRDKGSVIDYVQLRKRVSIGEVRKLLRPWVGQSATIAGTYTSDLPAVDAKPKDLSAVRNRWDSAWVVEEAHPYLNDERCIPPRVLLSAAFAGRVRSDRRGNALFAHYNLEGLSGFEIKNRGFTSMSPGGTKGLFISNPCPDDSELVICETAIDALSYASLFGTAGKRFASTAGHISMAQKKLLRMAIEALPPGGVVVAAFDNDDGGGRLTRAVEVAFAEVDSSDKSLVVRRPQASGEDWNDVLRRCGSLRSEFPRQECG